MDAPPAVSNMCSILRRVGDNLHRHLRGDVGVEAHGDLVHPETANGLLELEPAAVELDARRRLHRCHNIGRGDRAEEPALDTGAS